MTASCRTASRPAALTPSVSSPRNPPFGGHVDLYYSTSATFATGTAKLCVPAGSVDATAASAVWRFASSPAGAAAAGSYYLFARLKDADGNVVATAQTTAAQLLCLDAGMMPRIQGVDAVDGDRTVYLQNGADRLVDLQIAFPESVMAVGFSGAFDTALVEVTGITPGNGWDATGAVSQIFVPTWNNTTGMFRVNTSITGSPWGLNGERPVHPRPGGPARQDDHAEDYAGREPLAERDDRASPRPRSGITMRGGLEPGKLDDPLGEPAFRLAGRHRHHRHRRRLDRAAPDAEAGRRIDFADQMAFTVGWNGAGFRAGPDRRPRTGRGRRPEPPRQSDGRWDIDDILAFTTMYSWAASLGFSKAPAPGDDAGDGGRATRAGRKIAGDGKSDGIGRAWARTLSHAGDPRAGGELVVDCRRGGRRRSHRRRLWPHLRPGPAGAGVGRERGFSGGRRRKPLPASRGAGRPRRPRSRGWTAATPAWTEAARRRARCFASGIPRARRSR